MSNLKLCNKCKTEIKRGVRLDNKVYPMSHTLKIFSWTGEGGLSSEREYDLCDKCYNEFQKFLSYNIDNVNSHIDTANNENAQSNITVANSSAKQYVKKADLEIDEDSINAVGINRNADDVISNLIQIGVGLKGIKSVMKCGNTHWYNTKLFNKFQKYMWKIFFGIDIEETKSLYETIKE